MGAASDRAPASAPMPWSLSQAHLGSISGPSLAHLWPVCGPSLARLGPNSGPSRAQLRPISWRVVPRSRGELQQRIAEEMVPAATGYTPRQSEAAYGPGCPAQGLGCPARGPCGDGSARDLTRRDRLAFAAAHLACGRPTGREERRGRFVYPLKVRFACVPRNLHRRSWPAVSRPRPSTSSSCRSGTEKRWSSCARPRCRTAWQGSAAASPGALAPRCGPLRRASVRLAVRLPH